MTPAGASASDLLGYAHFGSGPGAGGATVGNEMLDDPEPGTFALLGLGLLALPRIRRMPGAVR